MPPDTNGAIAKPKKPKPGTVTGSRTSGRLGVATFPGELVLGGLPSGSYETYRQMRANPTIALARAVAFVPMRATPWTFKAEDDTPDEWVELVQTQMESHREQLLAECFRSLDYGFQSFEKVWAIDEGGMLVYERIKPLAPEWVTPVLDKDTGALIGLRVGTIELGPEKMFWCVHDPENDDPFGRARHENVRRYAWKPWLDAARRLDLYMSKSAGIVPMVHYPQGTSLDASGAEKDNSEIASAILMAVGKAYGVTIPTQLEKWAEDLLRAGVGAETLKQICQWRVEFLEAAAGHGTEMLESMKHWESLMLRGWLVPERAAIEGTYGTKAEAGTHGDLGAEIAGAALCRIIRQVNEQLVDSLLEVNFGPKAKGAVKIELGPMSDEDKAFFRDIFKVIFTAPANADLLPTMADVDAMLDGAGIPKAEAVVDMRALPAASDTVPSGAAGDAKLVEGVIGGETTPEAPVAPATGDSQVPADTILNGAQLAAAAQIVKDVAEGTVPRDAGIGQLIEFFNLTPEQAERIMGSAGKGTATAPNVNPADAKAQEAIPPVVVGSPVPKE